MDTHTELDQSLTRYLTYLSGRNISELTITAYRIDLSQFFNYIRENAVTVVLDHPGKITASHISDFLSHQAGKGRSGVTRVRKLAAIREYLKYLVDVEKILTSSPAEKIVRPKKERKQRVFLREDEYMRLLNASAGQSRDYAILQLFLQTGIRVAELVALTLSDIDLDGGTMLVNGKGNKQRTIFLEKKATQALRAYLAIRQKSLDQHIFLNYQGTGLSVQGIADIVGKYRVLAGITKKFSCHSLRHTCATYKVSKGYSPIDLQALLGHEKPETSFIYVHMARDQRQLMMQTSL
jgi:site-specific recombinase XerD